jgi:hypothetical protein
MSERVADDGCAAPRPLRATRGRTLPPRDRHSAPDGIVLGKPAAAGTGDQGRAAVVLRVLAVGADVVAAGRLVASAVVTRACNAPSPVPEGRRLCAAVLASGAASLAYASASGTATSPAGMRSMLAPAGVVAMQPAAGRSRVSSSPAAEALHAAQQSVREGEAADPTHDADVHADRLPPVAGARCRHDS